MKAFLRFLLRLLFGTRIVGKERLCFAGPSLVLPNHVSFLDAVFLYAYLPGGTAFVVNTDVAAKFQFVLRWVRHVRIDPLNPYSLKEVIRLVREGRPVVLFPEGRITTSGGLMKIYGGVGFIAAKTGAALYPLILLGPERSKVSRIRDKVRSCWFPRVLLYVGEKTSLAADAEGHFHHQKAQSSERILALLQQTLFRARQARDEGVENLFDALLAAARLQGGGKVMAADGGGSLSYRRALVASYVLGQRLRSGLKGEEPVGLLLPNSLGCLVTLFALCYLGKTPALLNFTAGEENNLLCSQTAGLQVILTSRAFLAKAGLEGVAARLGACCRLLYLEDLKESLGWREQLGGCRRYLAQKRAEAPGKIILFTSGSESKPKGVLLRHRQLLANLNQIASVIDYSPRDRLFNALPMFHSFGLTAGTLLPVLHGLEVFLYPSPLHYKVIPELVYDRNITVLLSTPTFLQGYGRYAHPYDFHALRYVLAGGEKLKDEVRQLWQEKFGLRILEGYGTTETAPVLSLNTPLGCRAGTVGRLLPGLEWRLEAVPGLDAGGNLLVQGPNVMEGYLLHGRGFVPAPPWYACGDVVSVDRDGFLTVRARLKRFAKVSGEMVSLDAVEQLAAQCFGTEGHAAVNLPDVRKGERIVLYTVDKSASRQALRAWLARSGQSMLLLPAKIVVVPQLPLLGSGKTDYVRLKELAAQAGGEEDRGEA